MLRVRRTAGQTETGPLLRRDRVIFFRGGQRVVQSSQPMIESCLTEEYLAKHQIKYVIEAILTAQLTIFTSSSTTPTDS